MKRNKVVQEIEKILEKYHNLPREVLANKILTKLEKLGMLPPRIDDVTKIDGIITECALQKKQVGVKLNQWED